MAGVDVADGPGLGVQLAEKEGDEAVDGRAFMDEVVELGGHPGQVIVGPQLRMEGRPQRGHEEGGADALARHVGQGDADAAGADGDEIIIVAADLLAGFVPPGQIELVVSRDLLGQEVALDLGRQRQLPLHLLLLQVVLDEQGVLDLDRGQVGQQGQQAEIALGERPDERQTVGVEDADDFLVVPERNAQGRADAGLDDALTGHETRVGRGVGDDHGELLLVGHGHDAPADLDLLALQGGVVDADGLDLQPRRTAFLEHQDAAVHRDIGADDPHDVFEELAQRPVQEEGLADFADDRGDLPLFGMVLGRWAAGPRPAQQVLQGDDRVDVGRTDGVVGHLHAGRRRLVVDDPDAADADLVAGRQGLGAFQLAAVEKCAVLAAGVLDQPACIPLADDGMAAGTKGIAQGQVVIGGPSDRNRRVEKFQGIGWASLRIDVKDRHRR